MCSGPGSGSARLDPMRKAARDPVADRVPSFGAGHGPGLRAGAGAGCVAFDIVGKVRCGLTSSLVFQVPGGRTGNWRACGRELVETGEGSSLTQAFH